MIDVLVACRHQLVRAGVVRLLADMSDIRVTAEARNDEQMARLCREHCPHVLLLYADCGATVSLAAMCLKSRAPGSCLLVLGSREDAVLPSMSIQAGARGYLSSNSSPGELRVALREVYAGNHYLGSDVPYRPHPATLIDRLSAREREVALLLARRATVQQIANMLCISPKTVHCHRYRIFSKMQLRGDAELILWAARHRLVATNLAHSA